MNKVIFTKFNLIVTAIVAVGVVSALGMLIQKPAQAQEALPTYSCDVAVVDGPSNNGLKVSADKKKVSATLIVTGSNTNCDRYATIAVWKSGTADGLPLEQQTYFGRSAPKKLSVGTHVLTADLPQCSFWQADLLGQNRAKSVNGDANYQMPQDILVNYKLGGKQCPPPPPTPDDKCPNIGGIQTQVPANHFVDANGNCMPDVCPNIDQMQDKVPDGYQKDANGNCVVIPGVTPPPVQPAAKTEALPDTGAGSIAAIASSVTAFGSGIAHFVIRRKMLV